MPGVSSVDDGAAGAALFVEPGQLPVLGETVALLRC
jgi:hypothetical protein